jgi:hypothetical protein
MSLNLTVNMSGDASAGSYSTNKEGCGTADTNPTNGGVGNNDSSNSNSNEGKDNSSSK